MLNTPLEFYENKISLYTIELQNLNKRINFIVLLRLISFLIFILVLVFLTVSNQHFIWYSIMALSVIAFLFLVKYHGRLSKARFLCENLLKICENEIGFLNYKFTMHGSAENAKKPSHFYSSDLNIVGQASVFQYINRTVTFFGSNELLHLLLNNENEINAILQNQESCRELVMKPEWRQQFQATGMQNTFKEDQFNSLKKWLFMPSWFMHKKLLQSVIFWLPAVSFFSLFLSYYIGFWTISELLYTFQFFIVLKYAKKINEVHVQVSSINETLLTYSELIARIENETFQSKKLMEIKELLVLQKYSASKQIRELSDITAKLDRRLNILAAFFLNVFYLADLRVVTRLEHWKERNKDKVQLWFDALGKIDAFSSLASYAFNNPTYTYPVPEDGRIALFTEDLGHPLIADKKRVVNNIIFPHKGYFVILTGANMAGKSTFLRTIGVNMVLAMAGAPVCAKVFRFKPMKLVTSISVQDSLFENESYFYAELKRLRIIIDEIEKNNNVFILLDEILKGTNSNDKMNGSKQLLQKLIGLHATGIVATHDISLGELEQVFPEAIKNYSFEVTLENDVLYYEYKLQEGTCKNLNATYLMKKMGIIN